MKQPYVCHILLLVALFTLYLPKKNPHLQEVQDTSGNCFLYRKLNARNRRELPKQSIPNTEPIRAAAWHTSRKPPNTVVSFWHRFHSLVEEKKTEGKRERGRQEDSHLMILMGYYVIVTSIYISSMNTDNGHNKDTNMLKQLILHLHNRVHLL